MGFDVNNPFSLPASADLSASQFCGVKLDTNGRLALPTAGTAIIGVLYTKPAAIDRAGQVYGAGSGIRKLKFGGTVAAGDPLKVDASGRFLTATANDVLAGSCVAIAVVAGSINDIGTGILSGSAATIPSQTFDDIVLSTTAPSNLTETTFVQTSGTQSKALANGVWTGQKKRIIQSVAAATPVGTITGTFLTLAGAAATTLALGTTVAAIADFVWTGAGWRLTSLIGGAGSSLS
jgi:hypothetical protein